ncbi:MAG: DUF2304 domain-containing protein [Solirubrobacterales bacterium]
MSPKLQVVAIVISSGLLLVVLELVRRRRLSERYALLWLGSALVLLVLSAWANLLDRVSDLVGVATPVNALFAIAFGFVLLLLLHFSVTVSRLSEENKLLAQEAARLDQELRSGTDSSGTDVRPGGESPGPEPERAPSSASTTRQ